MPIFAQGSREGGEIISPVLKPLFLNNPGLKIPASAVQLRPSAIKKPATAGFSNLQRFCLFLFCAKFVYQKQ